MDKATADKSAQAAKTFDPHHLVAQTGGDTALQRELLTLFEAQSFTILDGARPVHRPTPDACRPRTSTRRVRPSDRRFRPCGDRDRLGNAIADRPRRAGHLNRLPGAAEAALAAIRRRRAELF